MIEDVEEERKKSGSKPLLTLHLKTRCIHPRQPTSLLRLNRTVLGVGLVIKRSGRVHTNRVVT